MTMATKRLKKISFEPLQDQVYDTIKTAIMTGKFKAGEKLTVREMATSLGTSDMPIRAAFNRLLKEGALGQIATSGTMIIPTMGKENFREWMSLRAMLEERAIKLAAPNVTQDTIDRLTQLRERMELANQRDDLKSHLDTNFKFKHTLYSLSHSLLLLQFIDMLWVRVGPFLRNLSNDISPAFFDTEVEDIVIEAIQNQNPSLAGKAIKDDILFGMKVLLEHDELFDDTP
ncbi:MAG: GntR family transcriptional regulator [Pseudomonadota bacterium]